ncbi:MAG TPA: hypothetical protein VGF87_08150 [Acidimicrobiales bacterium]|jgi:uncharacterized integral membrane protein
MSRQWRWSLVVVILAAVVGSFMPSAVLAASTPVRAAVSVVSPYEPLSVPTGCFAANCSKGSPPAPALTLAAVAGALMAALALAAGTRRHRRIPLLTAALPRGSALPLFHPPQFS